jgi:hypothetical protein
VAGIVQKRKPLHQGLLKVEKQAGREGRQKSALKGKEKKIGSLLAILAKTSAKKQGVTYDELEHIEPNSRTDQVSRPTRGEVVEQGV